MKRNKTSVLGALLLAVAVICATPGRADAGTHCYIYIGGDCHGKAPSYAWFEDNYNGSPSNNGVCLHRAREFREWCAMTPEAYVNAAFNIDGTTINAQQFYGPGRVTTFGLNWAPLVTN